MPNRVLSPPPPHPSHSQQNFPGYAYPANRSVMTPSPGPGPAPGGLTAVQYPANFRPLSAQQLQHLQFQPPQPLQQSLYAPAPVVQPPPQLDAALDRLQTSLTALHERLASLESLNISPGPSMATLLVGLFQRALFALRLRATPGRSAMPFARSLRLLLQAALSGTRRAVGDMGLVLVVGVVLARWTGRGGQVAELLAKALGAGRERRRLNQ